MKKILLSAVIAGLTSTGICQIVDFETPLDFADTAWFGQDQVIDGDTTYTNGGLEFSNNYNAAWGSFTGWGYSNSIDATTPGYPNQFSAIAQSGENGSAQFGICYTTGNTKAFTQNGSAITFTGGYFSNTTYAYLSMLDGDSFAKKFGDSTNAKGAMDGTNGEDWFALTIYGLGIDSTRTGDSVNFYLADYRFSDNSMDYIVNSWEFVDLTGLGAVYGLDFKLNSSDEGNFGMNTPAYFVMDNLSGQYLSIAKTKTIDFTMYPNPAENNVTLNLAQEADITILDMTGKVTYSVNNVSGLIQIPLENLNSGIYLVTINSNGVFNTQKLIKK
jgi:hypothetical protein